MNAKTERFGIMLCMLVLSGCSQSQREDVSAREGERIRARFNRVLADFSAATDPNTAADIYVGMHTPDAILLFPGGRQVQGHAAIRPFIVDFAKNYKFEFVDWKSEEIIISGNLAVHRFSGTAVSTPRKGGTSVRERRIYLDVWRKDEDGEWRIARHIFNRND